MRGTFLRYHETEAGSSLGTVRRFSTATLYLENFAAERGITDCTLVPMGAFTEHLRAIEVSPNGHANTPRRRLRDKGVQYILECCRSMYRHGRRHGVIPAGAADPFASTPKLRVRDAKPIFPVKSRIVCKRDGPGPPRGRRSTPAGIPPPS